MRPSPSGVRNFWRSVSPLVRRVCYVLWSLGVIFLAFGYIGDREGWWFNRPFATNVVSSATTALFGIPIALVFIQQLQAHQEGLLEVRKTKDLALIAAKRINALSLQVWPDGLQSLTALRQQSV